MSEPSPFPISRPANSPPPSQGFETLNYAPANLKTGNTFATTGMALVNFGLVLLLLVPFGPPLVFISLVLLAIGAVYGFLGLRTADKTQVGRGKARWAAWGGSAAIVVLISGAFLISYSVTRAYARSDRVRCASNLRQIGTALILYANDNKGTLPPDFGYLVTNADLYDRSFCCPAGNETPAPGATPQQVAAALRSNPTLHSSYRFQTPAVFLNSLPTNAIVAYEPLATHENDGINVLFADGFVRWLDQKPAKAVLADLAAGKNPPPSLK